MLAVCFIRSHEDCQLTRLRIVADSKIRPDTRSWIDLLQPRFSAIACVTSDTARSLPDDLTKMSPFVECIRIGLFSIVSIAVHLAIIESV